MVVLDPWKYWLFFTTCILLSLIMLVQFVFGRMTQLDGQRLSLEQQTIQQGEQAYVGLERLAGRTYQLSQNDAGLKDVVIRQRITVKQNASTTSSAPAAPPAAAPAAPVATPFTPNR